MSTEDNYWLDFVRGLPLEKYGKITTVKTWIVDKLSYSDLWRDYR